MPIRSWHLRRPIDHLRAHTGTLVKEQGAKWLSLALRLNDTLRTLRLNGLRQRLFFRTEGGGGPAQQLAGSQLMALLKGRNSPI